MINVKFHLVIALELTMDTSENDTPLSINVLYHWNIHLSDCGWSRNMGEG